MLGGDVTPFFTVRVFVYLTLLGVQIIFLGIVVGAMAIAARKRKKQTRLAKLPNRRSAR
jgi:hypothetical protein